MELFEQALKISPQNISVLYGLASGLLSWSKECINLGAFGWAASLLEVNNNTFDWFFSCSHPY